MTKTRPDETGPDRTEVDVHKYAREQQPRDSDREKRGERVQPRPRPSREYSPWGRDRTPDRQR